MPASPGQSQSNHSAFIYFDKFDFTQSWLLEGNSAEYRLNLKELIFLYEVGAAHYG